MTLETFAGMAFSFILGFVVGRVAGIVIVLTKTIEAEGGDE